MDEQRPEGQNVGWSALLGAIDTAHAYASGPDELRIVTLRMDEAQAMVEAMRRDSARLDFIEEHALHSACKECERSMAKDWYERNRDKAKSKYQEWRKNNPDAVKKYRAENRQKHYRQEVVRKYGVDPEWFDRQIAKQRNACACCKREFAWGDKQTTPHVDHCHETQAIRGILCNRCNSVLGLCKDNDKLLSALARYLRKCHG